MKEVKKVFALMLAFAMVLAMSATVFAAGTNKIEVRESINGETYNIYKMMNLSVNSEMTAYRYTVAEEWNAFFTGEGAGAEYVEIDTQGYVTWKTDMSTELKMEAFSKAAALYAADKTTAAAPITGTGETITFSGLDNGYYLITSSLGTRAMVETTPDSQTVFINEKNPKDTITKEVEEDTTGLYGENNDAQIGDTINFKSVIQLLKNTRNVTIVDTMSSGLTYNPGSVAIEGLTEGTHYSVTETATGFTVSFTDTYLNSLEVKTDLNMTYTAVLNENAISNGTSGVSIVDQTNSIVLNFGNDQSVTKETTTTTHKFSVYKHANGSDENLAGAVFEVKKNDEIVPLIKIDDNNYRVAKTGESGTVTTFTTVKNGDIVIWGVDSDEYYLNETEPPEGYNKLPTEEKVDVSEDNSTRANIVNNTGTELPSTGGIGTIIFYVVGAALVVGCGVVLVSRRRVSGK